ncbi:MAG: SRPBCC domain-containing protein [candidate division Zixibacteria bacterium]|nr:SRPBCC domain-containing protein [candidate division Zixibacteria bacterium]
MADSIPHDWTQFSLKIEITVPTDKAFAAWVDEKVINKWFAYGSTVDPQKGGEYTLVNLDGDKLTTTIREIKKDRVLRIGFINKTEVEITFTKIKTGTRIELRQTGIKTTPAEIVETHLGCRQGWTFFLTNLKAFLEHKVDLRCHDFLKSYKAGYING